MSDTIPNVVSHSVCENDGTKSHEDSIISVNRDPSSIANSAHPPAENGELNTNDVNGSGTTTTKRRGAASKSLPKGPNGTPNAAYLEADDFLPPPQFEALTKQMSTGEMGPLIAAVAAAHKAYTLEGGVLSTSSSPLLVSESTTVTYADVEAALGVAGDASTSPTQNNNANTTAAGNSNKLVLSNKRIKLSTLCPKMRQNDLKALLIKTLKSAVMSFIYAGIGRLIIGISKSLIRCGLSKSRFLKLARREIFTANPFKWGAVAAGLSCYRLLQQLVLLSSPHMPVPISCAIGGGLASLPLMALNVDTRTELGLYLGVRAIHGAICSEWNNIPMPESWRNYKDWTVIYMVFLATQILYTFSFYPETHAPAYNKFVASNTKQHPDTMHCLAALVRRQYSPYFMKMHKLNNVNVVTPEFAQMAAEGCGGCVMKPGARIMDIKDLREACLFLHPYTKSCTYHFFSLAARHFMTVSIPLYLPLKVSTTLLFGMKKVLKKPFEVARKVLTSSLTSSAFLTLYAVVPHLILCFTANCQLHSPILMCACASVCGFSTFLEPPNRRIDLALYCSIHGFRSFVNLMHVKGLIPKPTAEWIFYLQTISIATLFYQYDEKYEYIHPNIRAACGWLLKEKHVPAEDVCHALEWQKLQDELKEAIQKDLEAGSAVDMAAGNRTDAFGGDAAAKKEEIEVE